MVSDLISSLVLKDPCKKCIVRSCCTEVCPKKAELNFFVFPHSSIKEKRGWAILTVISLLFALVSLINLFVKTIM
jgi:ferredoxin